MSGGPKVLVIRFSSIGDIVLTTPVYRILKKQLNAEVHLLTKQSFAMSVKHNPFIDKRYTIKKEVDEVMGDLKKEKYDFVVDLHNNLRSLRVKKSLGVKSSSFNKLNVQKWMLANLRIDKMPAEPHIVYRYVDTLKEFGGKYDGAGMDFFIADQDTVDVQMSSGGVLKPNEYVTIAVGASMPTKALEESQLRWLLENIQRPVALLGGPAESELSDRLANAFSHVVSFAGSTSLQGSASVLVQSKVLISPDTGLMHMGAALDHPVVSVWGNTVPRFGMTPFYSDDSKTEWHVAEVANLSCRPCSKIGYQSCPKGHFKCIREIDLQRIVELVK